MDIYVHLYKSDATVNQSHKTKNNTKNNVKAWKNLSKILYNMAKNTSFRQELHRAKKIKSSYDSSIRNISEYSNYDLEYSLLYLSDWEKENTLEWEIHGLDYVVSKIS